MNSQIRQRIIESAITAPNVDNAQPFFFRWEGSGFWFFEMKTVTAGVEMRKLYFDGRPGCLLECINIAASGEGLRTEIDFRYNVKNSDEPWTIITFHPDRSKSDELLPGLKLRSSDRRLYRGGNLTDQVFKQVSADAAQFQKCRLHFQNSFDQNLIDYLLGCEEFIWTDKHILPEMLSWVRWSQQAVQRTRDGLPWQAMGVNFLTSRLMRFVAKFEWFRKLARRSGGPLRSQKRILEAQVRSSAALGCITVQDSQLETMVQLGRLFLRAWVRLNMAGFGVQVMANPSIDVFQHVIGILPEDYPTRSKQNFARGGKILARAFNLAEGEVPAWMFRTGKSSPLPAEMRTLRLPLSNTLRSEI